MIFFFRYDWKKNGVDIDPNSPNIRWTGTDGNIQLLKETTSYQDQGYYQCVATNVHGSALSVVSYVELAVLRSFTGSSVKPYFIPEGNAFSLPCDSPKSIPPPVYSWSLVKSVSDDSSTTYEPSKRVQIEKNKG